MIKSGAVRRATNHSYHFLYLSDSNYASEGMKTLREPCCIYHTYNQLIQAQIKEPQIKLRNFVMCHSIIVHAQRKR